ncbi:MAG: hypothetical protein KDA79_04245 [Planctomycetaceae bacterium]|nr:hypothetical protein [Planctomycetaceae bacterium]
MKFRLPGLLMLALSVLTLTGIVGCGGSADTPAEPAVNSTDPATAGARPVEPDVLPSEDGSTAKQNPPPGSSSGSEAAARPANGQPAGQQPVFRPEPACPLRPDDDRPQHDDAALAELGIEVYRSHRLKLYTDVPAEVASKLPRLVDQLYRQIEAYFGPIPPHPSGEEYQMTGYLMRDQRVFRETGLLPDSLPPFLHGRQEGRQFWMNDQEHDYYRRHLLLHEATHCLMRVMPPETHGPSWYMEGMAELFGTHHSDFKDDYRFIRTCAMPTTREEFAGLGRITMIQDERAAGRVLSINDVRQLGPNSYLKNEPYAWSWALCVFLNHHPRFTERFQQLAKLVGTRSLSPAFDQLFAPDRALLEQEWRLFVRQLQHRYSVWSTATVYQPQPADAEEGSTGSGAAVLIDANRGWQSTGVRVEQGVPVKLTATGQFALAHIPRKWISEANGISLRYANGHRLGLLLGMVALDESQAAAELSEVTAPGRLQIVPIGSQGTFVPPASGTLFLRLNDEWWELYDNTGQVTVTISPDRKPPAAAMP